MPALFINIKIDKPEIFYFFKITILDIVDSFDEGHIKVRGNYKDECIGFLKTFDKDYRYYQDLQEKDWVEASLIMLENVKQRSVFLYLEDHRLLKAKQEFESVMSEFDRLELDQLQYSFFNAKGVEKNNTLPFLPIESEYFSQLEIDSLNYKNWALVNQSFCTFSMASIASVRYMSLILNNNNKRFKLYSGLFSKLMSKIFSYPKYILLFEYFNKALRLFSAKLFYYSPSAGYSNEMLWFQNGFEIYTIGLLKKELFANYDDDNGSYGESLIKRGLYPTTFEHHIFLKSIISEVKIKEVIRIKLMPNETYDFTYYPNIGRLSFPPFIEIQLDRGSIIISYMGKEINVKETDKDLYFSNMSPKVRANKDSELKITIFDCNVQ